MFCPYLGSPDWRPSFHVDDAAEATALAIDAAAPGICNIADDEPEPGERPGGR